MNEYFYGVSKGPDLQAVPRSPLQAHELEQAQVVVAVAVVEEAEEE